MLKNIACISYHTCPLSAQEGKEVGGMNIYVFELMAELARLGYNIDIYTRLQDASKERVVQVMPGLRVIHVAAGKQQSIPKQELIRYIPEFVENMKQFIAENSLSYDAYDCHYFLSGLIGLEMAKNVPLLITFHTLALMKNLVAKNESEIEPVERIEAEKFLVKKATKIISPTKTDQEYLEYLYSADPAKVCIISPGVNTHTFKPIENALARQKIGFHKNGKLILFVGRIEPLKGIDVLFYALKVILTKNPRISVCLWVVGGDTKGNISQWSNELQRLEKLRETLDLKSSVRFIGQKLPSELLYYYNAAELVVMPSQYESFGMTALEAMSCAVPVITTDVAGVSDLLDEKHASLITTANNPIHLASLIENLLTNESARQKTGQRARINVQDLDWEQVAKHVDSVLKKL